MERRPPVVKLGHYLHLWSCPSWTARYLRSVVRPRSRGGGEVTGGSNAAQQKAVRAAIVAELRVRK